MEAPAPPERILRPNRNGAKPVNIFVDASGTGLGSSSWSPGAITIQVEHRTWDSAILEDLSSNFRELGNIVFTLERMDARQEISDSAEIFIFTDNQHVESAFYRGTAKSPGVLELMFQLHKILIKGCTFIHMIWVAGRRMIDQGTDGLSQFDLTSGVMRGTCMLEFIPLAKMAMERQGPHVKNFLSQVLQQPEGYYHKLKPDEWFNLPHDTDGVYLWAPPPCLGDVAIYLLAKAQHMQPWNTHLVIIPSIMAGRWRRMLYKVSDLLCVLPFGDDLWPMSTEYEPLTLAFVLPILNRAPWRVKHTDICLQQDSSLRTLHKQCVPFVRD
ncbi:hypothetical protein ACA910_008019 [Epithemia clementina (nom. ined.)]